MTTLILLLLLQADVAPTPAPIGKGLAVPHPADTPHPTAFQINGKIAVGKSSEPAVVDVLLKNEYGTLIQRVPSFANGKFHFDNILLGRYRVSVVDARFNIFDAPLLLRDPEDTGKLVLVELDRSDKPRTVPEANELDQLDMPAIAATVPGPAFEEFKKGIDAIRQRSKDNPPEAHFTKATELAPDFYEAYLQLGFEHARQGRRAEAIKAMEAAAKLKPSETKPLSTLGRLYGENSEFQKAADTLLKIGSLGQLTADDRFNLGNAFLKLDKPAAAAGQLEVAISLAPGKTPNPYLALSNAYLKTGDTEKALAVLEDYLQLFPTDPNYKAATDQAKKIRDALKKANPS